jgi:pseudouridine synthase
MIRLQKFLAESGVASRRAGERMMLEGRVLVNGQPARELGMRVDPAADEVMVDGQVLRARRKIHLAVHKPPGCVCTRDDPEKRPTILQLLPPDWRHLFPVGRLDYESQGLIFMTNDGDFCLRLTHPRFGVRKTYEATVTGRAEPGVVEQAVRGVVEAGQRLKAERARVVCANNTRSVIELVLGEGKNREVRRLLGALGLEVERLVRTRIGPIKLGELPEGRWRTLTETEIKSLLGHYENSTASQGRPVGGPRPSSRRAAGPRRRRGGGENRRDRARQNHPGRTGGSQAKSYQRPRPGGHQQ